MAQTGKITQVTGAVVDVVAERDERRRPHDPDGGDVDKETRGRRGDLVPGATPSSTSSAQYHFHPAPTTTAARWRTPRACARSAVRR